MTPKSGCYFSEARSCCSVALGQYFARQPARRMTIVTRTKTPEGPSVCISGTCAFQHSCRKHLEAQAYKIRVHGSLVPERVCLFFCKGLQMDNPGTWTQQNTSKPYGGLQNQGPEYRFQNSRAVVIRTPKTRTRNSSFPSPLKDLLCRNLGPLKPSRAYYLGTTQDLKGSSLLGSIF